jgi:hypothetical protein
MINTLYAPNSLPEQKYHEGINVFLAGSIDMGTADNWQPKVTEMLQDCEDIGYVFNPRRLDFCVEAEQSITNAYFKEQVEWELDHLDKADIVFLYLDPASKAPISLLELGYMAKTKKLIVCCPEGFWRKGNIEVVCAREEIPLFTDLQEAVDALIATVSVVKKPSVTPEIFTRVMRFAGKERRYVSNPGITANECIVLANHISFLLKQINKAS